MEQCLQRRGNLPPRAAEALSLRIRGSPSDVAASEMGIALSTYRNHLGRALRDLGADGFDELFKILAYELASGRA